MQGICQTISDQTSGTHLGPAIRVRCLFDFPAFDLIPLSEELKLVVECLDIILIPLVSLEGSYHILIVFEWSNGQNKYYHLLKVIECCLITMRRCNKSVSYHNIVRIN
jgi:hypothetical protein